MRTTSGFDFSIRFKGITLAPLPFTRTTRVILRILRLLSGQAQRMRRAPGEQRGLERDSAVS